MKIILSVLSLLFCSLQAQPFLFSSERHETIPVVTFGDATMVDFTQDGKADFFMVGQLNGVLDGVILQNAGLQTRTDPRTGDYDVQVFSNNNGTLPNLIHVATAAGDLYNDERPDLVMMGATRKEEPFAPTLQIFSTNHTATPTLINTLTGLYSGDIALADFDGNGQTDILICGVNNSRLAQTILYKNGVASNFVTLPAFAYCDIAVADVDRDGDMDYAISGQTGTGGFKTAIYKNNDGTFVEADNLLAVVHSSLAFGDYDGDGFPDLLVSGAQVGVEIMDGVALLYKNNNGSFVDSGQVFNGVFAGQSFLTDFDNDGLSDVLLQGAKTALATPFTRFYKNMGSGRFELNANLVGLMFGLAALGDIDNDSDLDLVASGLNGSFSVVHYYKNNTVRANFQPNPPTNLTSLTSAGKVTLNWTAAQDLETPNAALTYNLQIKRGGAVIMSGLSNENGKRWVYAEGNASNSTQWKLNLPAGTYTWSVQALDASYQGSVWATEQSFTIATNSQNQTVDTAVETHPQSLNLSANFPNPFQKETRLQLENPTQQFIEATIFDALGRKVKTIQNGITEAGRQELVWDGTNEQNQMVGQGLYFCALTAGNQKIVQKIIKQ